MEGLLDFDEVAVGLNETEKKSTTNHSSGSGSGNGEIDIGSLPRHSLTAVLRALRDIESDIHRIHTAVNVMTEPQQNGQGESKQDRHKRTREKMESSRRELSEVTRGLMHMEELMSMTLTREVGNRRCIEVCEHYERKRIEKRM
eukprot:PhF_6_TR5178/c0_g1_i1/m.7438